MFKYCFILLICVFITNTTFAQSPDDTTKNNIINLPNDRVKEDINFVLKEEIVINDDQYGFFIKKGNKERFVELQNYNPLKRQKEFLYIQVSHKNKNECLVTKYYFRVSSKITSNKN